MRHVSIAFASERVRASAPTVELLIESVDSEQQSANNDRHKASDRDERRAELVSCHGIHSFGGCPVWRSSQKTLRKQPNRAAIARPVQARRPADRFERRRG